MHIEGDEDDAGRHAEAGEQTRGDGLAHGAVLKSSGEKWPHQGFAGASAAEGKT